MATVPGTPGPWTILRDGADISGGVVTNYWAEGQTYSMPNGGAAINMVQVRYSTSPTAASPLYEEDTGSTPDGHFYINGLSAGTTYYFWVRTRNSVGWSDWSSRTQTTTAGPPAAPTTPTITNLHQTSFSSSFQANGNGELTITEYQTGYGTDPSTPQSFISQATADIAGLTPGQTYYVWGRVKNAAGWGPWSARATADLLKAAWVDVAGVKKPALVYVRYGGVWKPAVAYVKIAGLWVESG